VFQKSILYFCDMTTEEYKAEIKRQIDLLPDSVLQELLDYIKQWTKRAENQGK